MRTVWEKCVTNMSETLTGVLAEFEEGDVHAILFLAILWVFLYAL